MANVSDVSTVRYSGNYQVDSLLYNAADWNYLLPERDTLYYTFNLSYTNTHVSGASAFSESQKTAARAILAHASSVTGISFSETLTGNAADFHFANTNLAGTSTAGLAQQYESWTSTGSQLVSYAAEAIILLDNIEFASINGTLTAGGAGYEVLLHEIGHALGLGHPFEGPHPLPAGEDNTNNTVMSYTDAGSPKSTYQSYDLLALEWIYGGDGLGGTWGLNSTNGPSLDTTATTPSVSFSNASTTITEGDSGSQTLLLTVNLSTAASTSVSVDYTFQSGSAGATDYTASNGTLNFSAGQTSKTIQVEIQGDLLDESDETFSVTLNNPLGALISSPSTMTLTIVDNDLAPNQAPVAANGIASTKEDISLQGNLPLASDANGDSITYALLGNASHGAAQINSSGSYTYTPVANFNGTDSFTFQVTDPFGASNTYTQQIQIQAINDTPNGNISIAGTALQGQFLTASNTLSDVDGIPAGGIRYQWNANGTPIAGANASTYLITEAEGGKTLTVTASYTDLGGTNEQVTSSATEAVNDTTPPTLTITDNLASTANRATSNINYTLNFNEAIFGLEVSDFQIANGTITAISGNGSLWIVQVTPKADQAEGVIDLILEAAAVSDAAGNLNALARHNTQALDTLTPTITATTPADGATSQSTATSIIITFSEAIARGRGNLTLKTADGVIVAAYDAASASAILISGQTLTLKPSMALAYETTYTLQIADGALQDHAGNPLPTLSDYSFTTAPPPDLQSPKLLNLNPADEASAASPAENILLTFSEDITRGSGNILLKKADGTQVESFAVATSSILTFAGNKLTINPSFNLQYETAYRLEIPNGAVIDQAGNKYPGLSSYNFTTGAKPEIQTLNGTETDDQFTPGVGNQTVDGQGGVDTIVSPQALADHTITRNATGYLLHDKTGVSGTDTLINIESIRFSDLTVNLQIQDIVAAAPSIEVNRIAELYVAFFNRTPDADGLAYWILQHTAGQTIAQISESFYSIGASPEFSSLTDFSTNMTNEDFIHVFYKNVLGRPEGADDGGLAYWNNKLEQGESTRSSLANDILTSAHTFKGDATWGWVADLLDNKLTVAKTIAIDWGLTYNENAYQQGVTIAAAVTPTDTSIALALVGISAADLHLL